MSHLRPALTITNLLESYLLVRKDLVVNIEEGILPNEHKTDDEDGVEFVVRHPITNQNTGNSKPKKKVVPSISHMTHKVFHGISLAKAKQLVQELSSRSQVKLKLNGDKDALARRYRDFVNLNNAQLGKQYPKTIEKMCQEINKREMAREKEAIKSKQQNVEKKIEALRNGESNSVFEELTKKIKLQKKMNDENRKNRRIPEDMEHSCWAGYRVVYSKVAQRPFYYHIETGAGTWDMPNELTKEPVRDMTSQSQRSCEQNDNNYDADVTSTPMPSNSNGNKGSTRSSTRKRKQLQSQNLHPSQNDNLNLGHDDKEEESGVVLSLSATSDVGPTTTATATTTESKLDMMATSIDTYAPTNEDELLLVNSTAMTQSQKANNPNREASASSSSGTQSHFPEYHPHENEKSWTCGTCTYVNENFDRVCEMCESEGPPRKSSRRSSQGAALPPSQPPSLLVQICAHTYIYSYVHMLIPKYAQRNLCPRIHI